MADNTPIEWTDATVNAVNGCSRVSPGCGGPGPHGGCYAERLAGTRLRNHPSRAGLTKQTSAGPRWTGEVRLNEVALLQPLRWRRPRKIFWNAHGDLFHPAVPDEWIDRCFAVMALTPHHIHQVLTKRSERMRAYFARPDDVSVRVGLEALGLTLKSAVGLAPKGLGDGVYIKGSDINPGALELWPLPNVWLGVSVEDQQRADERIPDLLATPAAVRFLSCEPLLGPVDLTRVRRFAPGVADGEFLDALSGHAVTVRPQHAITRFPAGETVARLPLLPACPPGSEYHSETRIHWVIAGGESGPNARPMHPDWARSLRDQCAAAGVPFFFKQWGEWGRDPIHEGSTGFGREDACAAACWADGRWELAESWTSMPGHFAVGHGEWVYRLGKRAAGRLLDGREHSEMPESAPC